MFARMRTHKADSLDRSSVHNMRGVIVLLTVAAHRTQVSQLAALDMAACTWLIKVDGRDMYYGVDLTWP